MRTIRGLLALVLVAAVVLALPATVLAQSAGDEQYTDPFQGQNNSGRGEGGDQSSGGGDTSQGGGDVDSGTTGTTGSATGPTDGTTESGSTAEAAGGNGSATLPVTGGPVTILAAMGAAFLLSGLALRRRV